MLEEELIDLMTFCLQNPDSVEVSEKHKRITEIGHELYVGGKCECGHFKIEHLGAQEDVQRSMVGFRPIQLIELEFIIGLFKTSQTGRGLCKKCTCPNYHLQNRFRPKNIQYPERTINNDDLEKRCTRCGRLLSNHEGVDHPFQDRK